MRTGDQEVSATSAVCTHQKCQVGYNALTRHIECTCHGSKFSTDGKVLKGPATQDLTGYRARLAGDQIVLEIDE
jgi:cytochrome b6-f complex iron-sulfur subunit